MATEKRLIDANALSEKIGNMKFEITHNRGGYKYCNEDEKNEWDKLDSFDSLVCEAPTVDAVEVVRCKDCKHRGEEGCCPMYFVDEIEWDDDGYREVDYVPHDYTVDDGFCDRGERRTNERKAD